MPADRERRTPRLEQIWFGIAALALAWLLMQAVHELGHVVFAWIAGSDVHRVVLHPLAISRTDVAPQSRFILWGGFVMGTALPAVFWAVAERFFRRAAGYIAFFAGFCAIANGGYLLTGCCAPVGDTRELARRGESPWLMAGLGLLGVASGLWIWHRLDRRTRGGGFFAGKTPRADVIAVTITLAVVVLLECLLSSPR